MTNEKLLGLDLREFDDLGPLSNVIFNKAIKLIGVCW